MAYRRKIRIPKVEPLPGTTVDKEELFKDMSLSSFAVPWRPNEPRRTQPLFTQETEERMEKVFALRREAISLLDLINAEFKSDPKSVQCFDTRIVLRVDEVLTELKQLDITGNW